MNTNMSRNTIYNILMSFFIAFGIYNIPGCKQGYHGTDTWIKETELVEYCGDCLIKQYNEECDPCVDGTDFCNEKCDIIIPMNVGLRTNIFYPEMITPDFDQEEGDLLCKIIKRNKNAKLDGIFYMKEGFESDISYISSNNINGKGINLILNDIYETQSIYYFKGSDLPENMLNSSEIVFHISGNCII